MTDSPIHINPWLATKLTEYRSRHSDEEMRRDYETDCALSVNLSWDEYHQQRALYEAMRLDSFLQTLRANMDLDAPTREHLYNFHIDCVADLLQVSKEELATCSTHGYLDLKGIKKYLKKHGYKLLSGAERTYKIPSLPVLASFGKCTWNTWHLNPPGSSVEFDLSRPTLGGGNWFDEYYARYEHLDGEERFQKEFAKVKPRFPHGEMPTEYAEFFQAIGNLFDSYEAVCTKQKLAPVFFRPGDIPDSVRELKFFPNRNFLYLWQESCRAVVDVFERTQLFRQSSAGKFLEAGLEEKLKIAEAEYHDQDFQLLLISFVELRIDTEDIISLLEKSISSPEDVPPPVNPWLAQVIIEYRQKHSDDHIRKRYLSYLADRPETSWSSFLANVSLEYKMHREPFLKTPRREFGFSSHLQDIMNVMEINIVADMLQFTIEEMSDFCVQEGESVAPVVQFLDAHGYGFLSYPENTYKEPLASVEQEKIEMSCVIRDARSRAESIMKHKEDPLAVRVEKTLEIYRSNEHLARVVDIDLKTQLALVIDYGRFCEEYMEQFPEVAKDAAGVGQRALYFSELIHGEKGRKTAGVHRLNGAILTKLEKHSEAAMHYAAAAAIMEEIAKPDDIWVGKDYRSAAVCNTRIPDYQRALELFSKAVDVFKKHPEKPQELEETYWNIAECYRQLKDKKNEEKYRLLAAAIRTTDEI